MRDATVSKLESIDLSKISIHASHAGRDLPGMLVHHTSLISIHASHAGRDVLGSLRRVLGRISIHASHAGRDTTVISTNGQQQYFNPRVPCGTRPDNEPSEGENADISIHASHAGRDFNGVAALFSYMISIHASHAGRDI